MKKTDKKPLSCCQYHKVDCVEGRLCPLRKHIKADPFQNFKVGLVLVLILAAFSLVGEMDYQDALAQEAPKTQLAKKDGGK